MSSTAFSPSAPRAVLADVIPGARVRDVGLIAGGALLTVLGAQIAIDVPPSPVPITGQTLAVVLAGGALGARRGAASQALYLVLGLFLPVYSDGEQGFDVIWGATGGYIVGFIVAAAIVGALAEAMVGPLQRRDTGADALVAGLQAFVLQSVGAHVHAVS